MNSSRNIVLRLLTLVCVPFVVLQLEVVVAHVKFFRIALMSGIVVALATDEVEALTQSILDSGVLPSSADRDAAHIALATVHEMDILLTWNCRHIANVFIQAKLRKLAAAAGFTLPVICTPEELLERDNEQND